MSLFGDAHPRYLAFISAGDRTYATSAVEDSPTRVGLECPAGHTNSILIADLTRRARAGRYPCPDCEWRLLFTSYPWLRRYYRGLLQEGWVVDTSTTELPWEDEKGRWNESPYSLRRRLPGVCKGARFLGRPEVSPDPEPAPVVRPPTPVFAPGRETTPAAKPSSDAAALEQLWETCRTLRAEIAPYRAKSVSTDPADLPAVEDLVHRVAAAQSAAVEMGSADLVGFAEKNRRMVSQLHATYLQEEGTPAGLTPTGRRLVQNSRAVRRELARLHALPSRDIDPSDVSDLSMQARNLREESLSLRGKTSQSVREYTRATVRRARQLERKLDVSAPGVDAERHESRLARITAARTPGRRWLGSKLTPGGDVGSTLESGVLEQLGPELSSGLVLNTTAVIPPMELDMFSPGVGAAIEVNGEQHHVAPRVGELYHRRKWELCRAAGVDLYGLWSGRWNSNPEAVLHEARRALRVCPVYPGGAGAPERVAHCQALEFLSGHSAQPPMPGLRYAGVRDARGSLLALAGYRVRSGVATVFRSASVGYVPGSTVSLLRHIATEASSVRWRVDNLAGYLRELEESGMVLLDDGAARRSPWFDREVWDAGASVFELR